MSNEMTEFRITSDLAALRQAVISANFDEVRGWLDENLEPYRRMAVTPSEISTAKTYRANIRKVRDRIDACRKEAKAAALAAYTDFETRCKELTGLCDEAATAIDEQVKAIEAKEADDKIERLQAEYIAMTDDETEEYLPWGYVNNPKWRNKGYSYDDAIGEIRAAIEKTRGDLAAIRGMGGDDTPYLLDCYKQTRDLSAVIRKASEIKTRREREEERERMEAERRAARERERENARNAAETPQPPASQTSSLQGEGAEEQELVTVEFRVTCTKEQLTALGQFMRGNGIRYGRI